MIVEAGQLALLLALVVAAYVVVASLVSGAARRTTELVISGRYAMYSVPFLLLLATGRAGLRLRDQRLLRQVRGGEQQLRHGGGITPGWPFTPVTPGRCSSWRSCSRCSPPRRWSPFESDFRTRRPTPLESWGLVLLFFLTIIVLFANPALAARNSAAGRPGYKPAAGPLWNVHSSAAADDRTRRGRDTFSIAMGALLAGKGRDDEWVDLGRAWGMVSWVILTIGLLLGAWWAYTILGWGGYWAWDPVENSALMPWLALTAFVHSIMVQKRRGMFRMWNMVLIIVAFTLAQLGMFINREVPCHLGALLWPVGHGLGCSWCSWRLRCSARSPYLSGGPIRSRAGEGWSLCSRERVRFWPRTWLSS